MFFTCFKFYKWYQITQRFYYAKVKNIHTGCLRGHSFMTSSKKLENSDPLLYPILVWQASEQTLPQTLMKGYSISSFSIIELTYSSSDILKPPIHVSDRLICCCRNLILYQKKEMKMIKTQILWWKTAKKCLKSIWKH